MDYTQYTLKTYNLPGCFVLWNYRRWFAKTGSPHVWELSIYLTRFVTLFAQHLSD